VLQIRDLVVSYGPVQAVRQINVDVNPGEVVAMIGPNGAGKTSTLRAISGLVAYQGTITFDGVDCKKANIEQLARQGLIHVPEGRHVFPSLNVHENLQVGTTAGAGRDEGFSIDDVYDLFPLDEPSLGLSPKYTQSVYAALNQVKDRIPMLLVEQNTVMALKHCSRAAVMVGGKFVLEGTAADLADREALVASYLGEEPALAGEEAALHREEVP
jgi:branched-chain amino acid transport system ATP-binding protein